MAIVDGLVYAVGGLNGYENLSTIERYDPALNSWKYCPPMKYAVSNPGVCALNGHLYVIGGYIYNEESECHNVTDLFQVFNPNTNKWKELKQLRSARSGSSACAFNSKLYCIGGWESSSTFLNLVDCYDPMLDKWETCPSMISMRYKPGVSILNNRIYICGGETLFNYYHDSIEAYNVEQRQWYFVTTMSSGRSWLSCTTMRLQNPLSSDEANEEHTGHKTALTKRPILDNSDWTNLGGVV